MMGKQNKKTGEEIRAAACTEGLPPMVAIATQISTTLLGNIVAFRGSGPIPMGLYNSIFTGEARPKPVTEKAKSSNIGPQAGRAVRDPRNGRYDKSNTGEFVLRPDTPPKSLEPHPLEITLRNIFLEMGTKYKLTEGKNPDENGILRFHQIPPPSAVFNEIVYSVNIHDAKTIPKEIVENYKLVFDELKHRAITLPPDTRFDPINLDSLCVVSAQHPDDTEPKIVEVLGGIVRDCDIDYITDPPNKKMEDLLGTRDFSRFLEPLDMSAHVPHEDGSHDISLLKAEKMRANTARDLMVYRILEINNFKWNKYNNLKSAAKEKEGNLFDQTAWEEEHAHLKPFVPENSNLALISTMVVTVGKGTAMQLYQALEINIIQQKILASSVNKSGIKVDLSNLDSTDKTIRNGELMKLHETPIKYSRQTIATSFIQHPSECHNEHYTSPRGVSVLVKSNDILLVGDAIASEVIQKADQYIPINPQWINPSQGCSQAETWVKHFLRNEDKYYHDKLDVKAAVNNFLKNEKNLSFIVQLQHDFTEHTSAPGTLSAKNYLDRFLKANPAIQEQVNIYQAALETKIPIAERLQRR